MEALTPKFNHLLHGGDYNPEQWIDYPGILEKDIELMKKSHINCVSVGIFSWAKLEPKENHFDLNWLEEIIDNLYENGIYTILATPTGAKPLWMSEKYPEIRRVNRDMVREMSGGRHNHCYTSPIYREKVRIINTKLAERFSSHPGVIMWHISNEYGGVCYCPLCQSKFRHWLKAKYKTLDKLNHAWWTTFWSHTYTDWKQIHAPVPIGENGTHGLTLDWKRFTTSQVADFMKEEVFHLKSINSELPITANFMYDFDEYNYQKLKKHIDVISWDSYPRWHTENDIRHASDFAFWHDYMRTLKKQPFLLMESTPSHTDWTPVSKLKKPGMHMLSSIQAVAHGSNSVQYFQFRKSRGATEKFHGAVVDHCGEGNTRVFKDVTEVGKRLEKIDADVIGSINQSEVAIVYDMENKWGIENAAGPRNMGMYYSDVVRDHYHAFWKMGINVDIIDEEFDISDYKIIIAPMLYMLRKGFDEKLRTFVENGGTLIATYHSGIVNETDLCLLGGWPGNLKDVFGIWNEEIDSLIDGEYNSIITEKGEYRVKELCALIHDQGAEVLGRYGSDFYKGMPALTRNSYGKGNAYYIAARAEDDFLSDFYGALADECSLKKAIDTALPEGVTAATRYGDDYKLIFLQNFSDENQVIPLNGDYIILESGDKVNEVHMEPYGVTVLRK